MLYLRCLFVAVAGCFAGSTVAAAGLVFIDTSIENASPLDWDVEADGTIAVNLQYDHERNSPNRAAGHWHFRLEGTPGSVVPIRLQRFRNVWNGKSGLPISDETITFTSVKGGEWASMPTDFDSDTGSLAFNVTIPPSGEIYVARLPPYRISDLERLLDEIRDEPRVEFEAIGKTVQGRSLEIVRVGRADAPLRVFVRARAHPWEPGGNWVVEGMVRHLIQSFRNNETAYDGLCVSIMPMANKDGVANGRTRFNMLGKDLNRDWSDAADPSLCPENASLEKWLEKQLAADRRPHLALEMHNDESGRLHVSRPESVDGEGYLRNMNRLETLLRQKTWFREGSTNKSFRNPGTLGEGWLARFGINAAVHELNANWIEGLQSPPSAEAWRLYGRQLCDVFVAYGEGLK